MNTGINIHDIGIARQIGIYGDGVEITHPGRLLFSSGTPGLTPAGDLPETFEEQAEQAWRNILRLLESAGMSVQHLVKIVQYLVRAEDVRSYGAIRTRILGEHRPASMLMIVSALPRPEFLIEIEIYAAMPEGNVK